MKKFISCVLVVAMMLSMAVAFTGCGQKKGADGIAEGTWSVFGVAAGATNEGVVKRFHELWRSWTDNPVEFVGGDLAMLMNAGSYPDVILRPVLQNIDIAKYASQGILIPLESYITPENTPNIYKMFTEQPTTKATSTAADGHIYALPAYNGNVGSYIETFWWINKQWLDQLGLQEPTTLDELKVVLRAFKANDCNGNGDPNDEIPFSFYNAGAYNYPETLLSCWGVSTKFGMYDGYLNVQDGQVNFTPVMDEWKEMIKFYADLNKEGLLDPECFTYTSQTFSSKCKASTPVIGCMFGKENPFGDNANQYKVIEPLSADGVITPVVHIYPGVAGIKNNVMITDHCEDPAKAMQWIDKFYDKSNTIVNWYGMEGRSFIKEGDMYKWNIDLANSEYKGSVATMYSKETYVGPQMPGYMVAQLAKDGGDIGVLIEDNPEVFGSYRDNYELYKDYLDTETWPRPYYSPEYSKELSEIQTDIHNYVEEKKAAWIVGGADVDAEWDSYLEKLDELNVAKLLKINQETYDVYQRVLDEAGVGK